MGNNNFSPQTIHIPTLVVCMGCIFTAPLNHREQGVLISKEWALVSMLVICIWSLFEIWKNKKQTSYEDNIAKTFFLVGTLECIIAFLQSIRVFASYNPFFRFTGSFTNPSMLAILLSVSMPIGLYYSKQSYGKTRVIWLTLTLLQAILLALSTSRTGILAAICSFLILFFKPASTLEKLRNMNKKIIVPMFIFLPLFAVLYLSKEDSTNGRILIWTNCIHMIMDKPLWGWGTNGFDANYMPYQAAYFVQHPNSTFAALADNISHPFNEYLLIAVKYGIGGFVTMMLTLWVFAKQLTKNDSKHKRLYICIFVAIAICALFSYPYRMPIIWVVSTYIACRIITIAHIHRMAKAAPLLLAIPALLITSTSNIREKWLWSTLMDDPHQELPEKVLQQYHHLYGKLHNNSDFLYNYGSVLHQQGKHSISNRILQKCTNTYNDYNVQMLIADNYRQLGMKQEAISTFDYARHMIPCRFLPLYYEMRTYEESGNIKEACRIAKEIIVKYVKVHNSTAVKEIIKEAKILIETHEDE